MTKSKKLSSGIIALYFAVFSALWIFRELVLRQWLTDAAGTGGQELIGGALKLLLWTLPAIILILRYKDDMLVPLRAMFTDKAGWPAYLPLFAVFALYNIAGAYAATGKIAVIQAFDPPGLVGTVLLVGITEEMVFRGFLLNATYGRMKPWVALALNSVMFLVIHFPIWISKGIFANSILSGSFLIIIALSLVFGWAFVKSKNILVPIALHMFWNLLVCLFFG